jgi:hypothetical protein
VMAEFARVLRPGGHLVIADVHHVWVSLGSVPRVRSASGEPGLLPAYRHLASDYLNAALPLGLQVRRCDEPPAACRWRTPAGGRGHRSRPVGQLAMVPVGHRAIGDERSPRRDTRNDHLAFPTGRLLTPRQFPSPGAAGARAVGEGHLDDPVTSREGASSV